MTRSAFIRNLGSGAAARIVSAALGMALLVLMARIWQASDFGAYLTGFNLFQLLQQTPLLGLHFLLARDAAAGGSEGPAGGGPKTVELPTAAALGLSVALATAVALGLGVSRAYPADLHVVLQLVGLSLAPTSIIMVIEMALTGRERLYLVAIVNIAESAARYLVFGVMIARGYGVAAVFAAFVALRFGALFLYLIDKSCRKSVMLRLVSFDVLRGYFKEVPVLFPVMLLAAIFSRLDVMVLSWSVTPQALAPYALAGRCYDLVLMVPSILVTVLLPVLARVDGSDPGHPGRGLDALVGLLLRYGLLIGILCASLGAVLAAPLLSSVFGLRYADATLPLQLLLFAAVGTAVNQLVACVLLVRHQQRLDLLCLTVAVIVLIPGLFIGIKAFGPWGAGLAVLVATLVQGAARILALRWGADVRVSAVDIAPPLIANGAMLGVTWLGRHSALVAGPAALMTFLIVAWLAGSIRSGDLSASRALVAKR
jgi:O-antigen/teichoic acid export membrane protein